MEMKRSTKFKMVNAILKLGVELSEQGCFPDDDVLRPYIRRVREALSTELRQLAQANEIAPGMRADWVYRQRFNMTLNDAELLRNRGVAPDRTKRDFESSRGVYLQNLFQPLKMYRFASIGDSPFVFIVENKTFAGREAKPPGQELGRTMSLAFFHMVGIEANGVQLAPLALTTTGALDLKSLSVSHLVRSCGMHLPDPAPPGATPRDIELLYEQALLSKELVVYRVSERLPTTTDEVSWLFCVNEPVDAEDYFVERTAPEELTKTALSRIINRRDGLPWKRLFHYTRTELHAMLVPLPPPVAVPVPAPAPLVPARGRGKGKGRGRGRLGRGRG